MASRPGTQQRNILHSIDLFKGGMDSDASPYTLPEGSAVLGSNVEFYRDNTIRSRAGYTLESNTSKSGVYVTQRLPEGVYRLYRREGGLYRKGSNGEEFLGSVSNSPHTFVRLLNSLLVIQQDKIRLYDSEGVQDAAVPKPEPLTVNVSLGGTLQEGTYKYTYNYLLDGGTQSAQANLVNAVIPGKDYNATITFPAYVSHPKHYKKRLYRQEPKGGVPLFIKELNPDETTYTDRGDTQSALAPVDGITSMPGGNIALTFNRRLYVIDGDTMYYSYPGNYAYRNVFWTEKVNLPTGESIRAVAPLGQGLIFFGLETALYMNSLPSEGGSFAPIAVPDGCVNQNAWVNAEDGTLFYVGKNGLYAVSGTQIQRISDPVNNYFQSLSLSEFDNVTLVYDQQDRRLLVSLPRQILVYYFQTASWASWELPGVSLDWFEGRLNIYKDSAFGILGESPTDNGQPIKGKFISGVHGLEDSTVHKLFRRVGLQVSASADDVVDLTVRALDSNKSFGGLPARENNGAVWGVAIWGTDKWSGNNDTTQTLTLPDFIQGRYIQFTVEFTTRDSKNFVLMGPLVVEYRARQRYGRV